MLQDRSQRNGRSGADPDGIAEGKAMAHQHPDGGAAKEFERHHGTHGVAGQTEPGRRAEMTKSDRSAGAHPEPPEVDPPSHRVDHAAQMIMLTDTDPRAGDHEVAFGGPLELGANALGGITGQAQVDRLAAGFPNQRSKRIGVRAGNSLAAQDQVGLVEPGQFVAAGRNADPWTAPHQRVRDGERGEHAEMGRAEFGAGPEDDGAAGNVFAGLAQVGQAVAIRDDQNLGLSEIGVFLPDDRVGPLRHRSTGEDAGALAGADRAGRDGAGWNPLDHREAARRLGRGAQHIAAPYRIAVHRGVGAKRDVDRARDRFREYAAQRAFEGHAQGRLRRQGANDTAGCLTGSQSSIHPSVSRGVRGSRSAVRDPTPAPRGTAATSYP